MGLIQYICTRGTGAAALVVDEIPSSYSVLVHVYSWDCPFSCRVPLSDICPYVYTCRSFVHLLSTAVHLPSAISRVTILHH